MKFLLLCAAALLLLSTCDKTLPDPPCPGHTDTTTLPPPTQCGANTFGCLVNGEVWVPEGRPSSPAVQEVQCQYDKGYFLIKGLRKLVDKDIYEVVRIVLYKSIDSVGTYPISYYDFDKTLGEFVDYKAIHEYETKDLNSGELTINKLDRENFIISGTFWFTAIDNSGDTLRVTEGRFDVRE